MSTFSYLLAYQEKNLPHIHARREKPALPAPQSCTGKPASTAGHPALAQPPAGWKPKVWQACVKARLRGATLEDIAAMPDVRATCSTVARHFLKARVQAPEGRSNHPRQPAFTPEQWAEIDSLLAAGQKLPFIAAKLKVTYNSLLWRVNRRPNCAQPANS